MHTKNRSNLNKNLTIWVNFPTNKPVQSAVFALYLKPQAMGGF
jgi:hypothetical protein